MAKQLMIRKANDLVEARYKLTLAQQRLILFLNAQIMPWDKNFQEYRISVKNFCAYIGIDPSNAYEEFIKMSESLISKTLIIGKGEKTIVTSWLSSATYDEKLGEIILQFAPALQDFLLELKGRFIIYPFNEVKRFKSTYSYRIYELLKQYFNLKERVFNIEELKDILQVKHSYKNYHDFKKYVLIVAKNELDSMSDINFDFVELKVSRKITHLKFTIYKNEKNKGAASPAAHQITVDEIDNHAENSVDGDKPESVLEFTFIQEPLTTQQKNAIWRAANGDIEKVRSRYEVVKKRQNVDDLVGYMINVLRIPDEEFGYPVPMGGGARTNVRKNRFVNFDQREIDFALLERLELEQLKQSMDMDLDMDLDFSDGNHSPENDL